MEGDSLGEGDGKALGVPDGMSLGIEEGEEVGDIEGALLGVWLGFSEGLLLVVGARVKVGSMDGSKVVVGNAVGSKLGDSEISFSAKNCTGSHPSTMIPPLSSNATTPAEPPLLPSAS